MMGRVPGNAVDRRLFDQLRPVKVLDELDGPRAFTFHDHDGELHFAAWFDENPELVRFLVVPFSEQLVFRLETGQISLREALEQPRLWVVDVNNTGEPVAVVRTSIDQLPQDELPVPGTMLSATLEPILRLRAIGEPIQAGRVPGSAIRFVMDGAQKALKLLAEVELNLRRQMGYPSRALKQLYDLPAQSVRLASFEVSFKSPLNEPDLFEGLDPEQIRQERAVLERVGHRLSAGLEWLTSTDHPRGRLPVPEDLEASRAIVHALKHLTPSSHSPIKAIELGGGLVQRRAGPYRLTQAARNLVNTTLRRFPAPAERYVTLQGRVGSLDADFLRFELRDIPGEQPTRLCVFDEELWDDVHDLLGEETRVEVGGVETSPNAPLPVSFLIVPRTADDDE